MTASLLHDAVDAAVRAGRLDAGARHASQRAWAGPLTLHSGNRVVVLTEPTDGLPGLVLKVARDPADAADLERERDLLGRIRAALEDRDPALADTIPRGLAGGEDADSGLPWSLETRLAGTPMPRLGRRGLWDRFDAGAAWLERMARVRTHGDDPWSAEQRRTALVEPLERLAAAARDVNRPLPAALERRRTALLELADAGGLDVPCAPACGDLSPGNVLVRDAGGDPAERIGVVDWDGGAPTGCPLSDLHGFAAACVKLDDGRPFPERLAAVTAGDGIARDRAAEAARRVARAQGVPEDRRGPWFWLTWLRRAVFHPHGNKAGPVAHHVLDGLERIVAWADGLSGAPVLPDPYREDGSQESSAARMRSARRS